MSELLTPREAALYARTRLETTEALELECRRRLAYAEQHGRDDDAAGARWAIGLLAADVARLGRTWSELPPAPCGQLQLYRGRPLLCGFTAGHPGWHAWYDLRPGAAPRSWWRRLFLRP